MNEKIEVKIEPSKPSITALSVASAFQRAVATKYAYLFSPYESELISYICDFGVEPLSPLSMNGIFARSLLTSPYMVQTAFFNRAVAPYYEDRIMLRKFMIRDKINIAITNGAKQIVFLGGGYDIRSFISAQEHPEVSFFELDRGTTRDAKINAMKTVPYQEFEFNNITVHELSSEALRINDNLIYLECDFISDDLSKILNQYGFKKEEKSLFIGEGLTMYLDEQENQRLLKFVHDLLGNQDSELILSYHVDAGNESGLSELAKSKSSEQYKFFLSPQNSISFATKCGFNIIEKRAPMDMLGDLGDTEGAEFYKFPENRKGQEYYYLMKTHDITLINTKNIEEVPDMNIFIPAKVEVNNSSCLQM